MIRRIVQISVPVVALYVAVGWNAGSSIFKPVRIMRSVVDAKTDNSSLWREIENFNLIVTFRHNPVFGSGYGHPYEEVITLPPIDYTLERYIPHNSLLSLWAYAGAVGFTGLTLLWVAGVYFAVRAYHGGRDPTERVAAMACFGAVPIYLVQSWGDLGLNAWTGVFIMGASLAVGGKIAVANGQWQERTTRPGRVAAARPAPHVRVEAAEPPRANTAN
jgi:O-antigen ligase